MRKQHTRVSLLQQGNSCAQAARCCPLGQVNGARAPMRTTLPASARLQYRYWHAGQCVFQRCPGRKSPRHHRCAGLAQWRSRGSIVSLFEDVYALRTRTVQCYSATSAHIHLWPNRSWARSDMATMARDKLTGGDVEPIDDTVVRQASRHLHHSSPARLLVPS